MPMRRSRVYFLGSLLIAALSLSVMTPTGQASLPPDREQRGKSKGEKIPIALAGRYYRGDGMGFNQELTLYPGGFFICTGIGCMGEYGRCSGPWWREKNQVKLGVCLATGMLERYPIGDLDITQQNGKTVFFSTDDDDPFFSKRAAAKLGMPRMAYFHRDSDTSH